jgi:hypothetical protein
VATRSLVPLLVGLTLLLGCGGDDKAEAKQAALNPAKPKHGALKAAKAAAEDPEVDVAKAPVKPSIAKTGATPAPATPAAPAPTTAPVAATPASTTPDSGVGANEQDRSLGRESFSYTGGSRDPFVSLLQSAKVGPELPDLLLVAIYYDTRNPTSSVVVMREKVGGRKYSLKPGDRLGRLKISEVRPKDVVFTIDDFGTERHETVSLRKEEKQ